MVSELSMDWTIPREIFVDPSVYVFERFPKNRSQSLLCCESEAISDWLVPAAPEIGFYTHANIEEVVAQVAKG